jgi:F5/8 type C domain/Calx-beta domain
MRPLSLLSVLSLVLSAARGRRRPTGFRRARPALEALEDRWVPTTPQILSVSGGFADGQAVQLSGSSFGTKAFAKPLLYANFEDGLAPSSLGRLTAWDGVQSMVASNDGYGGTHGAMASDGSGNWTMLVKSTDPYWTQDGQRFYIFKNVRQNFTITDDSQNYKIWRAWHDPTGTYPNIYIASNNGRVYVEPGSGGSQDTGFWAPRSATRVGTTDWMSQEVIVQASSGVGLKDGTLVLRNNNQEAASGTIMTRPSVASDLMALNYVVHGVIANPGSWTPAWSTQNRMWVDNVYVDTTWSRVVLGDASTYPACQTLAVQPPSAWSDSGITVTAQTAGFAPGSQAYVYVFDAAGNVNATGFAVSVGSAAPPLLPTLTIDDVKVAEGSNGGTTPVTFTVRLSAASSQPVTVSYATANGSAVAGEDYTAASGSVTFNPGETSRTITVLVAADTEVEPDETFYINLSSPAQASIADGQGMGTILNDDTPASGATKLAVASVSASGDDGNVPANTLDGDLGTRWSAKGDGQWIQYDLGAVVTVSRVQIAFYLGDQRTQAFDILVSTDGTSWATAFSGQSSGTTTGLQSFDFAASPARYVRIVGHGNSQSAWNSLTEVAIWGWPWAI